MFKDVPKSHWAYLLIERLLKMKAVSGYPDGTFMPDKQITRAETLAFIDKYVSHEHELIKELLPSVIQVTAKQSDGRTSLGSGVILDKEGYIATNCHVVLDGIDPSSDIKVFLDGLPVGLTAKVKYGDLSHDIAILKIQADPSLLFPVRFPEEELMLLDKIFCIGCPLGFTDTVSAGLVSCVNRIVRGNSWIQTDCAINPGNSGGGAFNIKGQFIGLPTFVYVWADSEGTIPVSNVGFIAPYYNVKAAYELSRQSNVAHFTSGSLIRNISLFPELPEQRGVRDVDC